MCGFEKLPTVTSEEGKALCYVQRESFLDTYGSIECIDQVL